MAQKSHTVFDGAAVVAAVLLGPMPVLGHAQEFSADVYYAAPTEPGATSAGTAASPHAPSKLYVGKQQFRLETRGLVGTILIANDSEHIAYALFPGQKTYQPLANSPSEYFRVTDPQDACPDWQRATEQKIACKKIGDAVVAGRRTVKYENSEASDASPAAVWIDVALKFVVKWEGVSAGAELKNIAVGPQPADLFIVPSDYTILQPQKAKSKGFAKKSH